MMEGTGVGEPATPVGKLDGPHVGCVVGFDDGPDVGCVVGKLLGSLDGVGDGKADGDVGRGDGSLLGC